jgi:hypothetical protein
MGPRFAETQGTGFLGAVSHIGYISSNARVAVNGDLEISQQFSGMSDGHHQTGIWDPLNTTTTSRSVHVT